MDKHIPIVFSGPSAAGKSTLTDYIASQNHNFINACGYTSRPPRIDDKDYVFLTPEEFKLLIDQGQLIEYNIYNGNFYGVSKQEFLKLKDSNVMFNVGYSSAKVIKRLYDETLMIYLMPPSRRELLNRFGNRELMRYDIGIEETIKYALYYEYLLISYVGDLDRVYSDFMDIFNQSENGKQKKLILAKNKDFINNFYKRS